MQRLLVLVTAATCAPNPQARFAFTSEVPACSEAKLREAVAARLGYDPFVAEEPLAVSVTISRGSTAKALVAVSRPAAAVATRTLSGPPDCDSLTNSIARALAAAVDPLVLTRPAPDSMPELQPPSLEAKPEAPQAPLPPPQQQAHSSPSLPSEKSSLVLDLFAAAGAELGQQPALTPGFRAGVRFGGATFTGLVEAALSLPSRLSVAGGIIDTFFVGADLALCAGAKLFAGCALVRGGGLRFQGNDFFDARAGWLPSFSAGVRASVEWPTDTLLAVQASAELRVPITRLKLSVGDQQVWEQGWVVGSAGAAVVVRVP